jgi:hypothetical protein
MQPNVPFPVRVFEVNLPGGKVPGSLVVTENGQRVDASLTPLREERIPFSAAFVLDTSLTMTGGPFAAARAAAQSFVRRKLPRSEVALYGFSAKPYVIRGWSAETAGLDKSLEALRTSYGTAVWDSVILASRELRGREGSARALVVLTDGRRDTTPTPAAAAIRAAQRAGVRVYVVIAGKGGEVQRGRLRRLSRATGGAFVGVDSVPEVRQAFADLARTLSRQYLVSYSSPWDTSGAIVDVRADFGGPVGQASYRIPALPEADTSTSFLFSTTGMVVVVAALVLLPLTIGLGYSRLARRPPQRRYKSRR